MACAGCYEKGSVPRTFLASYFSTPLYSTATDYTTAAPMINDATAMVEHYDNIGVVFDPDAGTFTFKHAGRYFFQIHAIVQHSTTDGTHIIVSALQDAAPIVASYEKHGVTNHHADDIVFPEYKAYVNVAANEALTVTLELVGHTTGTADVIVQNVFVEIIQLT